MLQSCLTGEILSRGVLLINIPWTEIRDVGSFMHSVEQNATKDKEETGNKQDTPEG